MFPSTFPSRLPRVCVVYFVREKGSERDKCNDNYHVSRENELCTMDASQACTAQVRTGSYDDRMPLIVPVACDCCAH